MCREGKEEEEAFAMETKELKSNRPAAALRAVSHRENTFFPCFLNWRFHLVYLLLCLAIV
jgi:hypothetical protein